MPRFTRRTSPTATGRRRRGQSLVELSLTIPVMAILLLGGFDTTMLVWDKLVAGYAARQGARLATEIGGRQTNATATQAAVDKKIVRNVLAVTSSWAYGTLQELDIYGATSPDGIMQPTDYVDQFDGSGNPLNGGQQTLTLERRTQSPPNETSLGIRLVWRFQVPAGTFGNLNFTEFTVMKMSPVLN